MPLRRQRENALLYVRGLVEHGGRKSLQPTLFRLEETPARYESMQQFLADSPWDPELLVRGCAERVAPEIGVMAWVVDDTGIVKDGKHSPGVKRQYSGTLGKIGNCQITVSVHAVGERGTLPLGWPLYLPEEWCDDRERRRKAKIPDAVGFETKPQLAAGCASRRPAGRSRRRRSLATAPTATTPLSAPACTALSSSTCSRSRRRTASTGRRRASRCPSATARRAAAHGRPPRPQTGVGARARRAAAGGAPGRRCPAGRRRRARRSRAASRSSASSRPTRSATTTSRRVGVADHRMAARRRGAERLLALQPRRGRAPRAARPARPAALDDRARLPPAQRRARARPLRRPQLPRLPPPLRARHLRPRLPHPGAARPKAPRPA